ncbi:MAG: hypothetical protein RL701_2874 [Pseudomonadota bacterium]|jgi:hypothetical protein
MSRIGWKRGGYLMTLALCAACAGELPDAADAGNTATSTKNDSENAGHSGTGSQRDAGSEDGESTQPAAGAGTSGSGAAARGAAGASGSRAAAGAGASPRTPAAVAPGRECAADALYEPNDSPGDPCWLQPNQKIATELSGKDIDDYFSIDVEKGVTYTFDIVAAKSYNRGLSLTIGDKTEMLIEYGYSNAGAAHIDVVPSASGRAILRINGATQYHFAIWDDQVTRDSSLEPNNSPASAADIEVGALITQQLTSPEDDIDYYRFDVTAGVTYTLDLTNAQGLNRHIFMTVDAAKTDLLASVFINKSTYHDEFKALATGKALFRLWNTGAYHFQILAPNPPQDPVTFEPNNSPSTATPIEVGTAVLSELSAIPDDNVDCFSMAVKANTAYVLHLERDRGVNRDVTLGGQILLGDAYLNAGSDNQPFTTRGADGLLIVRIRGAANYKFDVSLQ